MEVGDISIHSDSLQRELAPSARSYDADSEKLSLGLATPLPAGSKARLHIGFKGQLTGSMMGYYYSLWTENGEKKRYTLTQFEVRPSEQNHYAQTSLPIC